MTTSSESFFWILVWLMMHLWMVYLKSCKLLFSCFSDVLQWDSTAWQKKTRCSRLKCYLIPTTFLFFKLCGQDTVYNQHEMSGMMFLGIQACKACHYLDLTHSWARWFCACASEFQRCEEKISWPKAQSHITRSVTSGNLSVFESMSMVYFKLYSNWSLFK